MDIQNQSHRSRIEVAQELIQKNKELSWTAARETEASLWRCFTNRDERAQAVNA